MKISRCLHSEIDSLTDFFRREVFEYLFPWRGHILIMLIFIKQNNGRMQEETSELFFLSFIMHNRLQGHLDLSDLKISSMQLSVLRGK